MAVTTVTDIAVIGPCTVASCTRTATEYLLLADRLATRVVGTVCAECAEKTRRAAFLLELSAA
jgi:hypothetical protein